MNRLNSGNSVKKHNNTNNRFIYADNNNISAQIVYDYVSLISYENSQEMIIFAVQNLEAIIKNVIAIIVDNKELYLKVLNLVDIVLPSHVQSLQLNILDEVNENLNQDRAIDGL